MTAMMVFHNQLEAVESATPRERIGSGKISPTCGMSQRSDKYTTRKQGKCAMGWARLTDHDPGTGTPRRSKEEDVDSNEGDLGIDGGNVVCNGGASGVEVCLVESDGDTNDGNQELANEHAKRTPTMGRKP